MVLVLLLSKRWVAQSVALQLMFLPRYPAHRTAHAVEHWTLVAHPHATERWPLVAQVHVVPVQLR